MEQVNEALQFQKEMDLRIIKYKAYIVNKRGRSMSAAHRHIPCTLKLALVAETTTNITFPPIK